MRMQRCLRQYVAYLGYSGSGNYADSPVICLNTERIGAAFAHRSPTTVQTGWTGDHFRWEIIRGARLL